MSKKKKGRGESMVTKERRASTVIALEPEVQS